MNKSKEGFDQLGRYIIVDEVKVYVSEILAHLDIYLHNSGNPSEEYLQYIGNFIIDDIVNSKKNEQE